MRLRQQMLVAALKSLLQILITSTSLCQTHGDNLAEVKTATVNLYY